MFPTQPFTKLLAGAALAVAISSLSLQSASPPPVTARIGFGYSGPDATVGGNTANGTPPTGFDYNENRNVANSDLTALFGTSASSVVNVSGAGFTPTVTQSLNNSFIAPNGVMGGLGTTATANSFFNVGDPFNLGNAFNTRLGVIAGTLNTTSYADLANLGIFSLSFEIAASRSDINMGNPRPTPPATGNFAQVAASVRGGLGVQVGGIATTATDANIGVNATDTQREKLTVKLTHINGEQVIDGMSSSFMFQAEAVRLASWNNITATVTNTSGARINGVNYTGPAGNNQAPLVNLVTPTFNPVSVEAVFANRNLTAGNGTTVPGFDPFQLRAIHYTFKKIPDAGATLGMLGLGFAALVGVQRRLRR